MWHAMYGAWWMIQWAFDGWFSLGIHMDFRHRTNARTGIRFGPYIDLHLGFFIISLGYHPAYSGELDLLVNYSRGGFSADSN